MEAGGGRNRGRGPCHPRYKPQRDLLFWVAFLASLIWPMPVGFSLENVDIRTYNYLRYVDNDELFSSQSLSPNACMLGCATECGETRKLTQLTGCLTGCEGCDCVFQDEREIYSELQLSRSDCFTQLKGCLNRCSCSTEGSLETMYFSFLPSALVFGTIPSLFVLILLVWILALFFGCCCRDPERQKQIWYSRTTTLYVVVAFGTAIVWPFVIWAKYPNATGNCQTQYESSCAQLAVACTFRALMCFSIMYKHRRNLWRNILGRRPAPN